MLDYNIDTEDEDTEGLTEDDIEWLEECLSARLEDEDDDGGPEDVMTSLGYVELWRDGEIVYNGTVIYKLEGGE